MFGLAGSFSKFLIAIVPAPTFGARLNSSPPAPAIFPPVDTKDAGAVAAFVTERFTGMFPDANVAWLERIFRDIVSLFKGGHPDFAPIDVGYHDLEHTLQATTC